MKKNTGKKYVKLRGDETPTEENARRANDFMHWYAANMERLKAYIRGSEYAVDPDTMGDTFLRVYDSVALKGLWIEDYTAYYLMAYYGVFINAKKRESRYTALPEEVEIADTDFNSRLYEEIVETINTEVMEYVRENYDEISISLFEMYVGLAPDVSYKKLSVMLGIPFVTVWSSIGNVKKNVVREFADRKGIMLSAI